MYLGEGDAPEPKVFERTIGDLTDPHRSGSITQVVNAVSREMGTDVAEWRVDRILGMAALMDSNPQPDIGL